jgi:hypothetical protein
MPDISVQVSLTLADKMSAAAVKRLEAVERSTDELGRAVKGTGAAYAEVGRASEQAHAKGTKGAETEARAAKKAVDATKEIGRAAKETERADPGGKMARGFEQAEKKANTLIRAMRGIRTASNAATQIGMGTVAAGTAAYMAVKKPMDFERRLAMMSNTAFADRTTLEGRQAGMQELRASVDSAVRTGGGSRESAADALDAMIASGAVGIDQAKTMLPVVQKFATATGAQSTEIADILIRGVQNNFFTAEQAEEALNKALVAGQQGGFELKDMARWLPQMMASAQGMQSMAGFERLLASAQASVTTAGSKDQAGNNIVNLLAKINSREASDRFKNDFGVDLAGSLAARLEKGQLPLDAFVDIVDTEVVGKNKKFKELQKKAATAQGDDKKKLYDDMAQILQASAVGEVIADRQALMALVAEMSQRGYIKSVRAAMQSADGAVDLNHQLISGTTSAALERAANEKDMAMQNVLDSASPAIKSMTDAVAGAAQEFPKLTTAVAGAVTVFASIAAGSAVSQGVGMLFAGKGAAGAAATATAAAGTAANAGAAAGTVSATGAAGAAATGTGLIAAAVPAALAAAGLAGGVMIGRAFEERGFSGSWLDAEDQQWGRATGREESSLFPPETVAEFDAMNLSPASFLGPRAQQPGAAPTVAPEQATPVEIPAPQVNNEIKVYIDGYELTSRVEERIDRQSRRY